MKLLSRSIISCTKSFTVSETLDYVAAKALNNFRFNRRFSYLPEDPELNDVVAYLDSLKNYEKAGVPRGAGTDSDDGFDLGRMRRLMESLGNPQSKFKVFFLLFPALFCVFILSL